ncbi:hypothetical protein [Paucibacter soli]|uniref:hypothetical protein n=1 Tax=Paucibacter soli TaxID=3133433 RepID=UPI0030A83D8E
MEQTSLRDRMAATKRRQARVIAGLGAVEEPPVQAAKRSIDDHSDWVPQFGFARPAVVLRERAGQVREWEALLPSVSAFYGYSEEDIASIRGFVMANTQAGEMELARCIRQWRLDAVTWGFDSSLPVGVAHRARIQFRQDAMGMSVDENDEPYVSSMLDWSPEGIEVTP